MGPSLEIDDSGGQFLDAVEKQISLFDSGGVLCILGVRSVGLYDARNLVDLAVQATHGDEAGELVIEEFDGNAEMRGHRRELNRSVGFQELRVGLDTHLAAEPARVRMEHAVAVDAIDKGQK